jgi:hypothetical protein
MVKSQQAKNFKCAVCHKMKRSAGSRWLAYQRCKHCGEVDDDCRQQVCADCIKVGSRKITVDDCRPQLTWDDL